MNVTPEGGLKGDRLHLLSSCYSSNDDCGDRGFDKMGTYIKVSTATAMPITVLVLTVVYIDRCSWISITATRPSRMLPNSTRPNVPSCLQFRLKMQRVPCHWSQAGTASFLSPQSSESTDVTVIEGGFFHVKTKHATFAPDAHGRAR